jgi:hypothetical protein
MKSKKLCVLVQAAALLLAAKATSSGVVILLSDTVAPGPVGVLETFLNTSFNNVTEIRHANFALFSAQVTQDALLGTGAFNGLGPTDVVIIGRSLASADYDNFDAAGYNALSIPIVSLTSFVARQDANRLGWHASGATQDKSVVGAETTVTSLGASIMGVAPGTYDFALPPSGTDSLYNGLAAGTTAFGGGSILATIGVDTLAAYWPAGSAPGNTTAATVLTFPGARLLFNLDNDLNGDLGNITPAGRAALVSAIDFATPLNVPEPASAFLLAAGLGLVVIHRKRAR